MASTYTVLDGSTLEGGGQILRNATAFAALLKKPVQINNVRHGRTPPGLKAQHAAGLRLVQEVCSASAEGLDKGSQIVSFTPNAITAGDYIADPGTAGATTLLLQISLPCLLFAKAKKAEAEGVQDVDDDSLEQSPSPTISRLTLRGGTNAQHSPPIDYTRNIFLPFLYRHFSISLEHLVLKIKKRGYFPHGGGEISVRIPALSKGQTLPPVTLINRGHVTSVRGLAYVSGPLPRRIITEMRDEALRILSDFIDLGRHAVVDSSNAIKPDSPPILRIDLLQEFEPSNKAGSGIILWAETSTGCVIGSSALGSKGTSASKTGRAAADDLIANLQHGGCVDEYMQDQMIIFLALANGRSSVMTGPLSLHTRTAIWVAETLTSAKFDVSELKTGSGQMLIVCDGIGLEGRL